MRHMAEETIPNHTNETNESDRGEKAGERALTKDKSRERSSDQLQLEPTELPTGDRRAFDDALEFVPRVLGDEAVTKRITPRFLSLVIGSPN